MPSLPIPLISSLVLGFFLLQMWFTERRHGALMGLLTICAIQGLIISLAQHYRVPGMLMVQPITATVIPPMAWVAFQSTAVRRFQRSDWVHFIWPVVAILFLLTKPDLLDVLIPALFLGYGGSVVWHGVKGSDALPRMRLEAGDLPGRIWLLIGASLVASAFSDVLIVAAQSFDADYLKPWIISLYSSALLLIIGGLSLAGVLSNEPVVVEETVAQDSTDEDAQIMGQLQTLMQSQQLYLNPDLTLSQLSRKMLVPVKQLSGAINRTTGENVSRYILSLIHI